MAANVLASLRICTDSPKLPYSPRRCDTSRKPVSWPMFSFAKFCNGYTCMGCPPVRGYNPRALASGFSYVQVDKHSITVYITYISVDLANHEIFRA